MRRVALILACLLAPALSFAQEMRSANFTYRYELDATAITYCKMLGVDGSPFGSGKPGPALITAAASTTVAATTAGTNPFANVAVTDVIATRDNAGTVSLRVVTARASADSITVNSALTVTGVPFQYYTTSCGTTAESGWIDVSGFENRSIVFSIEQYNVTGGIDMRVECRDPGIGAPPVQIFPSCTSGACGTVQNYAGTAGITSTTKIVIPEPTGSCRVGMLIHTSDDGGDLTTNAEQITITFAGRVR